MKNLLILLSAAMILVSCSAGSNISKQTLDGTWVMYKMTGIEFNKNQLTKGMPVFKFDLSKKKFSGYAGCNQLASVIAITDSRITFERIIRTEMACPDMEVENAVISILNENTLHYEVADSELTLTSPTCIDMQFNHNTSD